MQAPILDKSLHESNTASIRLAFESFPQLQQEQLLRIQDDLGDEFPGFLNLFTQHSKILLEALHQGLANNDPEQVKMSLHDFKGMCGTIGATRVYHMCKQAETIVATEQLKTQQLISYIELELQELNAPIQQALRNSTDRL